MTDNEIRHLSRKELLEILIEQAKEINTLRDTVRTLEAEVEDKRVTISESGTMAEAVLKLNGILADADKAARQYVENARLNEEESVRILNDARELAKNILADAATARN